jgi:hypothetical protein
LKRQYLKPGAKHTEPGVYCEQTYRGYGQYDRKYYTLVSTPTGEWVKSAVLVRGVRTPAGPRLKHVCYLGTIREAQIDAYGARLKFWTTAEKNLNVAGIGGGERRTIEAALSAVVVEPDREAEAKGPGRRLGRRPAQRGR